MRIRNSESGSAVVEFALITPVLLLMLLGIVEFGRAWNAHQIVAEAARAGARVAAVAESGAADSARIAAWRMLEGGALDTARATITVEGADGERGTATRVAVGYRYGFLFLGGDADRERTLLLQSAAVMRKE